MSHVTSVFLKIQPKRRFKMAAYLIAMVSVHDTEKYQRYMALATQASQEHGGKYLVRGGDKDITEGSFPGERVVVVEFESRAKAHVFYNSATYQAGKQARAGAADFNMMIVDGV
jgi:uncharacterized protein (DUF1330 family)